VPEWHEFEAAPWQIKSRKFAWFLNFLFVAIPYGIFDISMQLWNIWMNSVPMNLWAGGNALLVTNTIVSLIQGVESWLVMAEISAFLEHMKLIRAMSLIIAIVYNLIWFLGLLMLYITTH
jgi:hypothetical protein